MKASPLPEQVGDAAVIAGRADGEMDVSGPHVANIGALHQLAHGAVHRDGVGDRRDGADGVAAVSPACGRARASTGR